ncbi:MAG: ABC transporter ATP-binding protein [Kiritimatiellia bacterium]
MPEPLVRVEDLCIDFGSARIIDGFSFHIRSGETVALVGESGCGKSMSALALARLVPEPAGRYAGGRVMFEGRNILEMSEKDIRRLRGNKIAYVFQEPGASLNPVMRVGDQIAEALRLHRGREGVRDEVIRLLEMVGIPDPANRRRSYPHQLSGGQQQRVMIAMALACQPKLLVADEPTTALDVTVQAQILDLLQKIQRESGTAILLITHNLGLVAGRADRVYVMYAGCLAESGPVEKVLRDPRHPYTRALLKAVPRLNHKGGRLPGIPGNVPSADAMPDGCRFHPRCALSDSLCAEVPPPIETVEDEHCVACHHWKRSNAKT